MRKPFVVLATLLLAATHINAQQWSAQRVLSIGEDQGVAFGRISGMTVSPDGHIYVLDAMESRVHAFTAAGKQERVFGKRGAGPGELSNLAVALLFMNGQLAVVDPMNQRISLFGVDGSFVRSRPLNITQGIPMSWTVAGQRLIYLARPMPAQVAAQTGGITQHTVFSLDPRGDAAPDTLLRFEMPPDNEISMGSTLSIKIDMRAPQMLMTGDGSGRILLAATDTYRIQVMKADGKTSSWLTRPASRHRYTSAEQERKRQQADSVMKAGLSSAAAAGAGGRNIPRPQVEFVVPEYAPVLSGLVAGDGYVLVRRSSESDDKPKEYDLLAYDGRLAGTLKLPARFGVLVMYGDRIYGIEKDELDIESVAVYRIAAPR